jgi:hypothetical protein
VYGSRSVSDNYRGFRPSRPHIHSCSQLGNHWDRTDLGEVPDLNIITLLNLGTRIRDDAQTVRTKVDSTIGCITTNNITDARRQVVAVDKGHLTE